MLLSARSLFCLLGLAPFITLRGQPAQAPLPRVVVTIEKPSAYVGSEEKGPGVFGTVISATLGPANIVYVADGSDQTIRVFAPTGRFLTTAGQKGEGPGDFNLLGAIWHDGTDRLYALDPYHGISVFAANGPQLRFLNSFETPGRASGFCGMDGDLFIAGYWNGNLVHVTDAAGAEKRAFGRRFRTDTLPAVQAVYDRAGTFMTCDSDAHRLYIAESGNDLVRAYTAEGQEVWEAKLPKFDGYVVSRSRGIAIRYSKRLTKSVVPAGEFVLVQAQDVSSRRTSPRTAQTDYGDVRTYVLSKATGALVGIDQTLALVRFTRGITLLGEESEPFPRLFLTSVKAVTAKK